MPDPMSDVGVRREDAVRIGGDDCSSVSAGGGAGTSDPLLTSHPTPAYPKIGEWVVHTFRRTLTTSPAQTHPQN